MASLNGIRDRLRKAPLLGAFFIALWSVPVVHACPAGGALQRVEVSHVVDGDTLHLIDGRKVRLIGVNAPEMGRKGAPAEPFAVEARRQLEAMVRGSGSQVSLRLGKQARDRYGRVLAYAFAQDGGSLEARLLAKGLAFLVAVPPNVDLVDCLADAEAKARASRLGLWKRAPIMSPAQLRRGGFALLRVNVRDIERNRGGYWLETGDDLVLNIPVKAQKAFDLARVDALKGRTVEVRGWVVERRRSDRGARWLLPLLHPVMIVPLASSPAERH